MTESTDARGSEWAAWRAEQIDFLTRVLVDVARDLARRVPPPRGMPFFGLDHPAGEFTPYERLAARGIFRKYESVLLVGAGLGGAARWCHAHFGCDVTGTDSVAAASAFASELSARARLGKHTRFVAASPDRLPLRGGTFTHAWIVEGHLDLAGDDPRLHQIFGAVRLGGLAAVQQSGAPKAWASRAREAMAAAGFAEVEVQLVERQPLRETLRRARERLLQELKAAREEPAAEAAALLEAVYGRWSPEGGPVTQVFGRRPA